MQWLLLQIKLLLERLMNQGKLIGRPSVGRLNMFFYDPKYKKTLPYYDTFPLGITFRENTKWICRYQFSLFDDQLLDFLC
jgi:hypothetical protein